MEDPKAIGNALDDESPAQIRNRLDNLSENPDDGKQDAAAIQVQFKNDFKTNIIWLLDMSF